MHERRNQLEHPAHVKPELIATAPNQVWSWDITRLRSTMKWQYFYLYVLLDIFSRYVVGWLVAGAENAGLACALIEETCDKHAHRARHAHTALGSRQPDARQERPPSCSSTWA